MFAGMFNLFGFNSPLLAADIVIPANAGIQSLSHCRWTPASAGVTKNRWTDFS